jgi:hypothetical protein
MQKVMSVNGLVIMRKGYGSMSNDNEWLDSETDDIKAIVHNTVEFTMIDRLSEEEIITLLTVAKAHDIKTVISKSGRIISTRADYVQEATSVLADAGVIQDVGLIKHITEYEIQKV